MKNAFLAGERVVLRPLEIDDAATVQPWLNDPDVLRHLTLHRPLTLDLEREYIAGLARDPSRVGFGIALREDARLVGSTGLSAIDPRHRSAGFGIVLGQKELWGRGLGGETTTLMVRYAFEALNLNRVWLWVYADNARAIRCYERVGFRREGVMRQHSFVEGRWCDTLMMAVLRDEWPGPAAGPQAG